ncbi:MAG TPA: NlpC/P60 family protein [Rhodothermales bacterium]|nr:NlpC/P60 family protein [Rhodothermales bacterium]HRR07056.1 NlpC/P60 family protein [Rhodothermales bacterium]
MDSSRLLSALSLVVLVALSSVGTSSAAVVVTNRSVDGLVMEMPGPKPMPISRAKAMLRTMPDKWRGVPYRFGGTSRRGIDCSAFVQQVMQDVFDVSVPRNTSGQSGAGERVSKGQLQPGDLILFSSRYSSSGRHVGIYVGDNEFLHISSTRNRVVIANLDSYGNSPGLRFSQARRIVKLDADEPSFELPAETNPLAIPMIATKTMQRVVLAGSIAF